MARPAGGTRQLLVLATALALWAPWSKPTLLALVLAYVAACALWSWLDVGARLGALRPGVLAGVALLGLVPGGAALSRVVPRLLEDEGFDTLFASFGDRRRLERNPSIAPALITSDEPQTYFVRAEGARGVRVRLAPGVVEREAEPLGAGVFRLDYDPRRDGRPRPGDGDVDAKITVDGAPHTRTMLAVTPLAHPRLLCVAPDRALAASVSRETDELVVVSARGLEHRIAVGDAPSDCAFLDAQRVAVSHERDAAVWIADAGRGTLTARWAVGDRMVHIAVSEDQTRLAAARAGLAPALVVLDVATGAVVARAELPASPDGIAFGHDAATVIVATRADATLHRLSLEASSLHESAALRLGRPVVSLGRVEQGARVLVATTDFRADGARHLGNHFVQDQLLDVDVGEMRVRARLLTARRTPRQSRAGDVDSGLSPMGIAEPRGGGLLVSFAGSDELWALDHLHAEPVSTDLDALGIHAPHGVAELADGTRVVTSPSVGAIALLPPDARAPSVLRLAPDDADLAAHARHALARRHGERGFYEGTRSGISCQSCHLHADTDLAAHNLGDHALLPTLSVRGLFATAPYLRDGSYAHLGDLDYVAQTRYRGYLRRAPGRAQTLEAYLASLPRTRSAVDGTARDTAAERRGLQVFVGARCPMCHAPPAFTNLGQQRPAALFPDHKSLGGYEQLDVPSLLSVVATAPYLSDGRAHTLEAVWRDHNRDNRHGDTARLTDAQSRDLTRFLESL